MEDINSSIYVQAKIEYTEQMINHLQSHFFDGVKSIYDDSKELYKENSSSSQLFIFRTLLEKVPEWNNELIIAETDRIIEISKCDYLEDLLTAVFISHTKILMSIGSNNDKINLVVPKLSNFIHKCYINIARNLWKNPLLFTENISGLEYQRNLKTIEDIIYSGIETTIRFSLPVKEILKGQLDLQDKDKDKNKEKDIEDKLDDNTIILNKLKELLNLKDDVEGNDIKDTEDAEDKEDIEESKPIISITKEEEEEDKLDIKPNIDGNGYDSPGEETIDRNCEGLKINDIEEVIVDKNVYDNPEIIDAEKDNSELYEKLVKIKQDNENSEIKPGEVVVSKIDEDKDKGVIDIPDILTETLTPEEKLKKEQETRNYDKIVDITESEKKEKEKSKQSIEDIIIIEDKPKKDDDRETVDLFMDDLQNMTPDKKDVSMDKIDESKYILFDDLN
jgi:hypothetical protein